MFSSSDISEVFNNIGSPAGSLYHIITNDEPVNAAMALAMPSTLIWP